MILHGRRRRRHAVAGGGGGGRGAAAHVNVQVAYGGPQEPNIIIVLRYMLEDRDGPGTTRLINVLRLGVFCCCVFMHAREDVKSRFVMGWEG